MLTQIDPEHAALVLEWLASDVFAALELLRLSSYE